MLNAVIRFALQQRLLVIAISVFLVAFGAWQTMRMPIDVFPDLNRPRVVIMTEALGMAPEEVESLITFPIETTMNGANGVEAVRSSSGVGISVERIAQCCQTNGAGVLMMLLLFLGQPPCPVTVRIYYLELGIGFEQYYMSSPRSMT